MKNNKRNFMSRIIGVCLSGIIGLMSFGGLAVEAKNNNSSQIETSVSASENEKKSEQYYRTKTGKCYHKEGCSHLKKSKIEVDNDEIEKAELRPCSKCCK